LDSAGPELLRAARLLVLRSRREATGLFAGNYASAFRGGGLEFEESRPYVPGDDVRTLDWNATARSGIPFVKRFREERDQTVLFGLDVSASMAFGTAQRSKAGTAVHTLALLAAAAARAGDRTGLVAFDAGLRARVPPSRGRSHGWRVIRSAALAAAESRETTDLARGLRTLRSMARRRGVILLLSDFLDPALLPAEPAAPRLRPALADLARRHDLVAGIVYDPRDEHLPPAGRVRIADPERPGVTRLLNTGSARVRERYAAAWQSWRSRLSRELRAAGADLLWLRTDRSPLHALSRFFRDRARRRASAA
jgi:uncharacterized protein (DUF58 family)